MSTRAASETDANPGAKKRQRVAVAVLTRADLLSIGPDAWRLICGHLPPISVMAVHHAFPYVRDWTPLDLRPRLIEGMVAILKHDLVGMFNKYKHYLTAEQLGDLMSGKIVRPIAQMHEWIVCAMATKIVDLVTVTPGSCIMGEFLVQVLRGTFVHPLEAVVLGTSTALNIAQIHFGLDGKVLYRPGIGVVTGFPGLTVGVKSTQKIRHCLSSMPRGLGARLHGSRLTVSDPLRLIKNNFLAPIFSFAKPYISDSCPCCVVNRALFAELLHAATYHFMSGFDMTVQVYQDVIDTECARFVTEKCQEHRSTFNCPYCARTLELMRTNHWHPVRSAAMLRSIQKGNFSCSNRARCLEQLGRIKSLLDKYGTPERYAVWARLNG